MAERIVVLNLNGQSAGQSALWIRKAGVFADLLTCPVTLDRIRGRHLSGILLMGDAALTKEAFEKALQSVRPIFSLDVPILAMGSGMELMVAALGGRIGSPLPAPAGRCTIIFPRHPLFLGLGGGSAVHMWDHAGLHTPPEGFRAIAITEECPVAAIGDDERRLYGLQFPLDGLQSNKGIQILVNFLKNICHLRCNRKTEAVAEELIGNLCIQAGEHPVVFPLTCRLQDQVAAALAHQAVGDQLTCILTDDGLCGQTENEALRSHFQDRLGVRLDFIHIAEPLFDRLEGLVDSDEKWKIYSDLYQDAFSKAVSDLDLQEPILLNSDCFEDGSGPTSRVGFPTLPSVPDGFANVLSPLSALFPGELEELARCFRIPEDLLALDRTAGLQRTQAMAGTVHREKIILLHQCERILREAWTTVFPKKESIPFCIELLERMPAPADGACKREYFLVLKESPSPVPEKSGQADPPPVALLQMISRRVGAELPAISRVLWDFTTKTPNR